MDAVEHGDYRHINKGLRAFDGISASSDATLEIYIEIEAPTSVGFLTLKITNTRHLTAHVQAREAVQDQVHRVLKDSEEVMRRRAAHDQLHRAEQGVQLYMGYVPLIGQQRALAQV